MNPYLAFINNNILNLSFTMTNNLFYSFCNLSLDVVGGGEADPCSPNPCKNGGTCQIVGGTFKCNCAAGFSGPTCNGMLRFLSQKFLSARMDKV